MSYAREELMSTKALLPITLKLRYMAIGAIFTITGYISPLHKKSIIRTLSFLMVVMLFTAPFITLAQQTNDAAQAISDAERDAKSVNTVIWAASGCVFSIFGILLASIHTPTVPAYKLLGKSPEYVEYYTSTYQQSVKNDQIADATLGCLSGGFVAGVGCIYWHQEILELFRLVGYLIPI